MRKLSSKWLVALLGALIVIVAVGVFLLTRDDDGRDGAGSGSAVVFKSLAIDRPAGWDVVKRADTGDCPIPSRPTIYVGGILDEQHCQPSSFSVSTVVVIPLDESLNLRGLPEWRRGSLKGVVYVDEPGRFGVAFPAQDAYVLAFHAVNSVDPVAVLNALKPA